MRGRVRVADEARAPGLETASDPGARSLVSVAPARDTMVIPSMEAVETQRVREATEGDFNPKYTFDSFVMGSSNRFAHAAAMAVAE